MVIDTSALIAILLKEPERPIFLQRIGEDARRLLSAGTLLEASLVATGLAGPRGIELLDQLVADLDVTVVPVDLPQVLAAREGLLRFGKGRHPAGLNFGDLFGYGLAQALGEPLLFKGEDFSRTDVQPTMRTDPPDGPP